MKFRRLQVAAYVYNDAESLLFRFSQPENSTQTNVLKMTFLLESERSEHNSI